MNIFSRLNSTCWLLVVIALPALARGEDSSPQEQKQTPAPATDKWQPAGQVTGAGPMSGATKKSSSKEKPAPAGEAAATDAPAPEKWRPAGQVTPPAPSAGAKSLGFIPRPLFSLGEFQLNIHGRIQPLVGLVGEDANSLSNGDVMNRDGFRLRRARLGVDGQISEHWKYDLELDLVDEFSGGNVLLDAGIVWAPCHWAWLRAGVGKTPFSRLLLTSSAELQFIERPHWVARENSVGGAMLDPGRQVGLTVGGAISFLRWRAGIYNGSPGFSSGDFNDGLMYAVRLEGGLGNLGPAEADLDGGPLRFAVGLNGYLNQAPAANIRAAGLDAGLKWRGLSLWLEAVWAKAVPEDTPQGTNTIMDETESWGMAAQAGYLLPLEFLHLEVAARFAIMDDNVHFDDEGDMWELTAGVNLYLMGNDLKLMLNYIIKEEMHGADLANDAALAMLQLRF